ncbi:MAG: glycosyltransferase family 4 protein [Rhodocyclaceae bacterium]|nr:glycosyltransferase family 4 protein [Pseudomonadota bacterium]MDQ7975347.1 glycosyltransferase family 4 protein [Rhodocyclaceae bacterium]MDQ7999229.1 glycosyltransferase family 4 protein [Pseudomonadota bacterium]MDQ8019488.1 glycosyltransferase family 4 protein [Pseudomonadota bacterium]
MKILIYSSVFYPAIGGIENHTRMLAGEFVRAGHSVKVVTEQAQGDAPPLQGIEIVHSSRRWKQLRLFAWADVVYMPNITLKGAWLFAFNPFKKWVVSHNDFHLTQGNGLKTRLKRRMVRHATRNVAVSASVSRVVGTESDVIYNCYDDSVFRVYPEEKRDRDFVFVGRLVQQKGCDMLIDACRLIQRPFTLTVVGEGTEYDRLRAKVETLKLQDRIHFSGYLQGEALARCLNRHRTMVVPSMGPEGFGIVALEGLACGCRMIVSEAGGLPEAVAGHADTFAMGDLVALHRLLERALDEGEPRTAGRGLFLDRHMRPHVASQYLGVFERVVGMRPPGGEQAGLPC